MRVSPGAINSKTKRDAVSSTPTRMTSALKRIPGLREAYYAARVAGRAAADWLSQRVTGRTVAARRLEQRFRRQPDPWRLETTPEERRRFRETWALVPAGRYRRILEIGCAEGHFTEQILSRFPDTEIAAIDLAPTALARAQRRCGGRPNVRFDLLDVGRQPLPGVFDLIFCMGVLEYGPAPGELDVIRDAIVKALAPGGYLLLETEAAPADLEASWWALRLGWGARAIHDRFARQDVVLVREAPVYDNVRRAFLFQKELPPRRMAR